MDNEKKIRFSVILFIAVIIIIYALLNRPTQPVFGVYKSEFPQLSIDLQDGGKLFISPYSESNKTIYCATQGQWSLNNNEISLSIEENSYCNWISDLNGKWMLTKCKNFDGSSNWCISKDNFILRKEN